MQAYLENYVKVYLVTAVYRLQQYPVEIGALEYDLNHNVNTTAHLQSDLSHLNYLVTLSMKPSVIRPYKGIIRALIMTYNVAISHCSNRYNYV